jgi:hypothetical protein
MQAIDFLSATIRHVANRLTRLGLVSLDEFTPGMSLDEIKAEYSVTLYVAMADYLESGRPITSFRNSVRSAVTDAFTLAFYAGYADAGGSGELPDEAVDWLNGRIEQEIGFADGLFEELKSLRADESKTQDEKLSWAEARANGYTGTLNSIYSYGQTYGGENIMATFDGDDGNESCPDCQRMKGQRHSLKWWREHDLIPRPGNPNYECGNWPGHCHHGLYDDEGNWIAGNE